MFYISNFQFAAPLPPTSVLLGAGLLGLVGIRKKLQGSSTRNCNSGRPAAFLFFNFTKIHRPR